VGNLHGFHAGDDDVIRRVLAQALLTGTTTRGDQREQQDAGGKEPTADHRRPI